ncbi:MAG: flagellar hook-associated protein 3 [Nitrospiraceae bacterium]|nr:MAG: flagellar hook-associated protein 3 [Nitrospiraceae bacterium]
MRITAFTIFNQMTRSLQERIKDMFVHSEQLSTGKKINKPSDDVFGTISAMDYKVSLNEIEQYMKNMDEAESQLGLTDTIMSSVANSLIRARELAVGAATDTQTAESRASMAEEVANLRDEVMRLSQTKLRNRYIFSGYKTDTQPFDSGFNYAGDTNEMNILTDRDSSIAINITGDEAFSYGSETFMETLDNLYDSLVNNDAPAIRASITSIDNDINQVANVRASVGARMNYLERVKTTHEDRSLTMKTMLSNTEDADIAGNISELTKIQVALESLRASGSKVISQSLMDFLG